MNAKRIIPVKTPYHPKNTPKEYRNAKKPRHIVNGNCFWNALDALDYVEQEGYKVELIETILNITIYHVKANGLN